MKKSPLIQLIMLSSILLVLSACTASNQDSTPSTYGVSMRQLSDSNTNSLSNNMPPIQQRYFSTTTENAGLDLGDDQRDDGVAVTINISQTATSTVYCEDSSDTDCACNADNVYLSGIFIKPDYISVSSSDSSEVAAEKFATYTRLVSGGNYTGGDRDFTKDDVIGIDIDYNDDYVRMSDIYIFDQESGGNYPFIDGVAEDIFINTANNTHSVSFDFPIGSEVDSPTVSTTGCWMKIVLDFHQ